MPIDVFTKLEEIVIGAYKGSDLDMFYFDTPRRNELMRKVTQFLPKGALVLDAGCAPGFTSLALKLLGFTVFSLDVEPEPYKEILERYGCKVIKADLECGCIPLPTESMDGVIFTEVLEHLNPYYISSTMCELNRVLKTGGFLFLSTPNIVSIGKRVKAIFGKNPIGQTHVKEYTMDEVKELVNTHGFHIEECYYSLAYDRIPYKAESKDYLVDLSGPCSSILPKKISSRF
jgi:SAM-dependent methyltransferase